jgi:hypothetical protein
VTRTLITDADLWKRPAEHEAVLAWVKAHGMDPAQMPIAQVIEVDDDSHLVRFDTYEIVGTGAGEIEDQLRAHLQHARVVRATVAASAAVRVNYLDRSVSYLMQWISALLAAPFALDAGRQALELARRAERAAGLDRLVHHLPVPCPSCDTRALTREDGAEQVDCQACGRVWLEDEYRRLTLILASDYRDVAGARA